MRKRVIIIALVSVLVVILAAISIMVYLYSQTFSEHFYTEKPQKRYALHVNDMELPDEVISRNTYVVNGFHSNFHNNHIIVPRTSSHIGIPFLKVFETLGGEVSWSDDNLAELSYGEDKYILNLSDLFISKVGDDQGLNYMYRSSTAMKEILDKEILMDSSMVQCTLDFMRIKVRIRICDEEGYVLVYSVDA